MPDTWPTTHIPLGNAGDPCNPCEIGHEVLFGPGRLEPISHVFTVRERMVTVRGIGLPEGTTVTLQMEAKVCGEIVFDDVMIEGDPVILSRANNVLTVTGSGRYRMVLDGSGPEDVTVIQKPTDADREMGTPTRRRAG